MKSSVLYTDINEFCTAFPHSERLKECKILITGSTGLVGSMLLRCLLRLNDLYALGLSFTCPVRNIRKVWDVFSDLQVDAPVNWVECEDICLLSADEIGFPDYVFHLAAPTASAYLVEHPVETLVTSFFSTRKLLDFMRGNDKLRAFVYVSSLESYGTVVEAPDAPLTEDFQGYVNPLAPRSCYPMGKRAAECLCAAYATEYNVPTRIARLTQTFGSGVHADDKRVFAQFARSILKKEDIVLHTEGESAKPYCYITDTISALIYVALFGKNGEAYNVANASSYISIREMAEMLCREFSPSTNVRIELHPERGYAPTTFLPLDTTRLEALGWHPQVGLREMFRRLMEWLGENSQS